MRGWDSCPPLLIEAYREGAVCPPYARLYSSVFSLLQKTANVRVESSTVNDSEFQSEGPEVAKLRDPYRASRLRGIVSDKSQAESGRLFETLGTAAANDRSPKLVLFRATRLPELEGRHSVSLTDDHWPSGNRQ